MDLGVKEKALIDEQVQDLLANVQTAPLLARALSDWRPILIDEVQVFVFGENYIGKRFDQINYKMMALKEAKEVLIDNLYALLRTKYFVKSSDEADDRIKEIVKSFTENLKTTLKKVSLDDSTPDKVSFLPDGCIAFRNGVYDFKKSDWLFKYQVLPMPKINNKLYMYPSQWIITWYLDIEFDPLPIDVMSLDCNGLMEIFKVLNNDPNTANLCSMLLHNMSYNSFRLYDQMKLTHICQTLGYLCCNSFLQKFTFFVGEGQNGKNSLIDGCFSHVVVPKPSNLSYEDIENDAFATGTLHNKAQNIFLETDPQLHTKSAMIKQLTGSIYQSIHEKGIQKYQSLINCKYLFSANDQDKLKFEDATHGFRRRVNILELFYMWDAKGNYLSKYKGTYDVRLSDDFRELKSDKMNTIAFCYFAMVGLKTATKGFTSIFEYDSNDWSTAYSSADLDVQNEIRAMKFDKLLTYLKLHKDEEEGRVMFYDTNYTRLTQSLTFNEKIEDPNSLLKFLSDEEKRREYFSQHDIFVSVKSMKAALGYELLQMQTFTSQMKKAASIMPSSIHRLYNNNSYVKIRVINNKVKILP